MENHFDLLILGSGSTAFAAALRAAELGKTAAMTEMRTLGGTCVNRGCLPSKNLIEAARIVWESSHPRYKGLKPAKMKLDFGELISQKQDVVHAYRDKKYQSLVYEEDKIKVFNGLAELIDKHTVLVGGQKVSGDQILIATGTRPTIPQIEGLDHVPYLTSDLLTSDEGQELKELPESMVIIGGGYIALELGQMFHRFGTRLTILERNQVILPNYEPEVSEALTFALREEGLQIVTGAQVVRVSNKSSKEIEVVANLGGKEQPFKAQKLLVATGREPNTDNAGLDKVGVQLDEHGFVKVNDELQTNISNIWAAGDVIGRQTESQPATPVGAHDGVIVAKNALAGAHQKVDHRVIPRTIFTDPQVAVVGQTDEEAVGSGIRCWCGTIPLELVPRAGATHQTNGIAKMVINRETQEVVGVSLVMPNAGEVIHEAAMALRFRAKLEDYIDMIHVYPTMAEALKIAAISYFKDPAKLSCCAE
ncbi:MAG TPA: mercury(II) reductase [Anaerolineales bacterium]|jgi:mercuric reductase|nr:mercury(II) reductase [Anaerolineales bacterium]MBL1170896.1 mercury(II) reductase [Chloroflexota bacterium]MBN8657109.1 mercury(II) reductase [Anaerolineae bacterium]RJP49568.1 MAG: mercury(II) reductase [Anaerolineaceae bacterium]NOG74347.1 mercury(II) reductase [Chloroflexota bacterium]